MIIYYYESNNFILNNIVGRVGLAHNRVIAVGMGSRDLPPSLSEWHFIQMV